MKKLAKKIVAAFVAATMTTTMVMSAGAYSASYLGRTSKYTSTTRYTISCFETGTTAYGNVSGTAWTKTNINGTLMNPDYAFEGQINVVNYCGSTAAQKNAVFSDGVTCSLSAAAVGTTVTSNHGFVSNTYGNFGHTLNAKF